MKKLVNLGKSLSKEEQKKITGGSDDESLAVCVTCSEPSNGTMCGSGQHCTYSHYTNCIYCNGAQYCC